MPETYEYNMAMLNLLASNTLKMLIVAMNVIPPNIVQILLHFEVRLLRRHDFGFLPLRFRSRTFLLFDIQDFLCSFFRQSCFPSLPFFAVVVWFWHWFSLSIHKGRLIS